jgi:hypothetical protein
MLGSMHLRLFDASLMPAHTSHAERFRQSGHCRCENRLSHGRPDRYHLAVQPANLQDSTRAQSHKNTSRRMHFTDEQFVFFMPDCKLLLE